MLKVAGLTIGTESEMSAEIPNIVSSAIASKKQNCTRPTWTPLMIGLHDLLSSRARL